MGWNDDPGYTPPNPPAWFWWFVGGVIALFIVAGIADQLGGMGEHDPANWSSSVNHQVW